MGREGRLHGTGNAAEAVQAIGQALAAGTPFDLVLLDWVLPDGEGTAVMRRLLQAQPTLQVAVISAYGSEDVREQAQEAGCHSFLDKPVLPDDLRSLLSPERAAQAAEAQGGLEGLRLLLAEDNQLNQELAVELLTRRGAQVVVVHNGLQAVERLAADGPDAFDAVLMDLQMPVLDGLEATRRLRAQSRFANLPIIAFTAHALAEESARSLAAGMQGYVTKPLNMTELVRVLQPYLGRTQRAAATPEPPARRAAATVPEHADELPPLPGIDTPRALEHFDHSPALLKRTLRSFAQTYGEGLGPWRQWIAEQRWSDLRRAVHTLQGLAGTVGAMPLRELALALEVRAREQDEAGALRALAPLQAALARLVADLDEALPPSGADAATNTTPAELAMPPDEALAGLRELLEQSDSQAIEWWQAHRRSLRAVGLAINAFDFDTALAALQSATGAPAEASP